MFVTNMIGVGLIYDDPISNPSEFYSSLLNGFTPISLEIQSNRNAIILMAD